MGGSTVFLYHDDFLKYQFGARHPFQPVRERMTLDTLRSLGALDGSPVVVPTPVDMDTLMTVHLEGYIERVRELSRRGGLLDRGDTPARPGLYEGALMAVGATVDAARGIARGEFEHAFNPAGGLHHAHPARAAGFCVFNDIAVAVRALQREFGIGRVAVVDIDAHHGDGTQAIFYDEDVLTISLHRYGYDMGYTTRGYAEVAKLTHEVAHELCEGRYLVLGGGGYDLDATRRAWSIMYCIMSEVAVDRGRIMELHDQEVPLADRRTADRVLEVIEEVRQQSLPLLERVIRYA